MMTHESLNETTALKDIEKGMAKSYKSLNLNIENGKMESKPEILANRCGKNICQKKYFFAFIISILTFFIGMAAMYFVTRTQINQMNRKLEDIETTVVKKFQDIETKLNVKSSEQSDKLMSLNHDAYKFTTLDRKHNMTFDKIFPEEDNQVTPLQKSVGGDLDVGTKDTTLKGSGLNAGQTNLNTKYYYIWYIIIIVISVSVSCLIMLIKNRRDKRRLIALLDESKRELENHRQDMDQLMSQTNEIIQRMEAVLKEKTVQMDRTIECIKSDIQDALKQKTVQMDQAIISIKSDMDARLENKIAETDRKIESIKTRMDDALKDNEGKINALTMFRDDQKRSGFFVKLEMKEPLKEGVKTHIKQILEHIDKPTFCFDENDFIFTAPVTGSYALGGYLTQNGEGVLELGVSWGNGALSSLVRTDRPNDFRYGTTVRKLDKDDKVYAHITLVSGSATVGNCSFFCHLIG